MFRMAQNSVFFGIESIREYVTKQGFGVELTDDEILDVVDEYSLNDNEPIKTCLNRVKLSIGDELVISRLCAIKGVVEYFANHEIVNDEALFEFISELIDDSINELFNNGLEHHFSTDDIYELLAEENEI